MCCIAALVFQADVQAVMVYTISDFYILTSRRWLHPSASRASRLFLTAAKTVFPSILAKIGVRNNRLKSQHVSRQRDIPLAGCGVPRSTSFPRPSTNRERLMAWITERVAIPQQDGHINLQPMRCSHRTRDQMLCDRGPNTLPPGR